MLNRQMWKIQDSKFGVHVHVIEGSEFIVQMGGISHIIFWLECHVGIEVFPRYKGYLSDTVITPSNTHINLSQVLSDLKPSNAI